MEARLHIEIPVILPMYSFITCDVDDDENMCVLYFDWRSSCDRLKDPQQPPQILGPTQIMRKEYLKVLRKIIFISANFLP